MKKKLGISIIVGVIILSCILGVIGVAYTTFSNVYAADTREDFSFAKENGKVKTYKFPLGEDYGFNMILPNGVNKKDVIFSEKNNSGLLNIKKGNDGAQIVTGVKLGKGTLIATITVDGKQYETSTTFQVTEQDFSFPISDKVVKQYVGDDALVVGETKKFKLKLPKGYTMDDVEYIEDGNKGLLEINDDDKSVTARKEGSGVLVAHIKESDMYASVNFEVIADKNNKNSSKDNNTSSSDSNKDTATKTETNKKNNKSNKTNCSIKFNDEQRIVTYNGKNMKIYETPVTTGIKAGAVEWSSSDSSIAEVSAKDKVSRAEITIKKTGKVTITASYPDGGVSATKEIIVHSNQLGIIDTSKQKEITDTTITLDIGDTLNISMKEENQDIANSAIEYTSSNGKICSVDQNGNIKALAKGTTTIKGMLKDNNKTNGEFTIKVTGNKEESMQLGTFSFPIDPETNKVKTYTGKYSFVVGEEYAFDMVRPEGTETYPIEYSCSVNDMMEVTSKGVRFLKTGSGTLTAKMKIGNKTKSAKTKFQVVASMEEKEQAGGTEVQYINLSFDKESMAIEKGNSVTLKPTIDTNIPKKDYELVWSASEEGYVEINKNGRVTPLKAGTVDVTVSVKGKEDVKATIKLEIQEEVTLVSSLKIDMDDLKKKSNTYLLTTDQPYTMNFSVLPSYATLPDYSIEVEDKENFIVDGKTVIALTPGVKTKLTARALDSGNKSTTINIESVISDAELASLQSILDNKEINIKIGETLRFRNVENLSKRAKVTRSGSNFILDSDENLITITGKKLGQGKITVKYNDQKIEIPVNVIKDTKEENTVNPVTDIIFPVDQNTAQTKDYVNNSPLQVGKYYNVDVSVLPESVTNKDVVFSVSDTSAFSVTSEGSIVANEPDKTATLTATSVANPEVYKSIRIASTDAEIQSIKFAKDYVGDKALTTANSWSFNLIITLTNGYTYDPVTQSDITNNSEYKRLLSQIVITSSNESLVKIKNNEAYVVKGVNGSGTLNAYVSSNPSIKCTARFDSIGIDEDEQIRSVKFAKKSYNAPISEGQIRFLPVITLTSGRKLDPSKDWDKTDGVATTQEYKNYLSQLKLVNVAGTKSGMSATEELVAIINQGNDLLIEPRYGGECELGIALKDSNNTLAKTKLIVTDDSTSSNSGVTGSIEEIDHATTTTNRNLDITKVKFVDRSYELNGNYGYSFRPIISLSDGTELSSTSLDQDTYNYYIGLTDFYLVNDSSTNEIDFGVVQILNDEAPKQLVPLKNGKIILAVGSKSNGVTYDTVPVTVNLK